MPAWMQVLVSFAFGANVALTLYMAMNKAPKAAAFSAFISATVFALTSFALLKH